FVLRGAVRFRPPGLRKVGAAAPHRALTDRHYGALACVMNSRRLISDIGAPSRAGATGRSTANSTWYRRDSKPLEFGSSQAQASGGPFGHAAAAPPSRVMTSRRFIRSPRRRWRAASTGG